MNTGKFVGCTMILVGSIIGAGMLGLPMVSAAAGFTWASALMIVSWILATLTGLLIIEINLALPSHACTFSSMAEKTLGGFGKTITWISYLFLLYAITVAYITGEASNITKTFEPIFNVPISSHMIAILFTCILGIAVFWSTKATDHFNRGLISVKGVLLIATLAFIMPHVDIVKLATSPELSQSKYLLSAAPFFLGAFCFQFVIPSLRIYIGNDYRQLKSIVIFGTTIALIIYLLWLIATLGTVPLIGDNSFTALVHKGEESSSGAFTQLVILLVNNHWVTASINGFTNIAMTTSFLGVTLSLFDFLADGFKRPNTRFGRFQTALLTFVPPLLFALFYPDGFLMALNYAAVPMAILTVILPALMVYKLRKSSTLKSPYRVKCGNTVLALVILSGVIFLVLAIMYSLHLLPVLK